MKKLFTTTTLLLTPLFTFGQSTDTNNAALNSLASHARALDAKLTNTEGKVELLQHQMQHMETGFLVVILIMVIFFLVVCVMIARKGVSRSSAQGTFASSTGSRAVAIAEEKK